MREPDTGRPSRGARMLAVLVVVGMVGLSAPVLYPVVSWFLSLL